jgi:hypothetical protein
MLKRLAVGLVCALLIGLPLLAQAAERVLVRGEVMGLEGSVLTVKSRTGATVRIHLAETFAVRTVVKASLADIKVHTYIGTAAMSLPDGKLKALEVLIFPESARGTAEGHFPWDLEPGSTMTNAAVAEMVSGVSGPVLTLKYKGGEKQVVVPEGAPIVSFEPGQRDLIQPGVRVFVVALKGDDGTLKAAAIYVGHAGVDPPM